MPDRNKASSSPSSQRRGGLQPIAPRTTPTSSSRATPAATTGRAGRLSHRSRAGCWTCRDRKVKCDERHPKCSPCTRLGKECTWEARWQFADATSKTQDKHANVTIAGNTVWDPNAPRSSSSSAVRRADNLPEFASLTNDEDRERKAETRLPGTFAVVATPNSFSVLPEYAGASASSTRRPSVQSGYGSVASPGPVSSHAALSPDPNTVVLDRFEEPTPTTRPVATPSSQSSMPDAMRQLSLSASPRSVDLHVVSPPHARSRSPGDRLVRHFREHVAKRILPQVSDTPFETSSPALIFEREASRFRPLYHAICAISALSLSYQGRASIGDALQHYQNALNASATPITPEHMPWDGAFLRDFLLYIYDICVPTEPEPEAKMMWEQQLTSLGRIAVERQQHFGYEPLDVILWSICELDLDACLLGSGQCDFVRAMQSQHMLPSLQHSGHGLLGQAASFPGEVQVLRPLQNLKEGVLLQLVTIAQTAQQYRATAKSTPVLSPGLRATWQANVSRLQHELGLFWSQNYPTCLGPESPQAAAHLTPAARTIFEHAFLLYQTAIIYSRTSMFPAQRSIPLANQADIQTDTERRCLAILTLAGRYLDEGLTERRYVVFPVFLAGFATSLFEAKNRALEILRSMQGPDRGGIGQNTFRTWRLLSAVCQEQQRVAQQGGRMEDVDWLDVARISKLSVVNCGL